MRWVTQHICLIELASMQCKRTIKNEIFVLNFTLVSKYSSMLLLFSSIAYKILAGLTGIARIFMNQQ